MPIALVLPLLLASGHALRPSGHFDDARPNPLSAGDLDRDDRLDTTERGNAKRPPLMLSSEADGDALVSAATIFQAVGC